MFLLPTCIWYRGIKLTSRRIVIIVFLLFLVFPRFCIWQLHLGQCKLIFTPILPSLVYVCEYQDLFRVYLRAFDSRRPLFPPLFYRVSSANNQGVSYVAWPRLNPPIVILSYNGPGARSLQRGRGLSLSGVIPFIGKGRSTGKAIPAPGAQGRSKTGELEMGRKKGALID